VLFFGGGPNHDRLGFRYWQHPAAFLEYQAKGNTGKFLGFWTAMVRSGFAFILSPELVAITAGESEAPRRNIPKASSRFVYRLAVFYGLGSLVISVIVACNDSKLVQAISSGTSNAGASPFVLGIQNAGIPVLNHIINGVILTSATSAGNSFLYAASRMLYSLAINHQAPQIFRHCSKNGVPYVAVLFSALLACLVYLTVSAGSAQVFTWFLNLTTISGFVAWIVMFMTYLRWRKAMIYQGLWDSRPYKTPFQPYTTWFALVLLVLLTITNGFQVFFPGNFTAASFLAGKFFPSTWAQGRVMANTSSLYHPTYLLRAILWPQDLFQDAMGHSNARS
jgi:amino acid transporter